MIEMSLENQIEEILNKDVCSLITSQKSGFDQLIALYGPTFVLFGAGRLGKIVLAGFRTIGIEPLAFTDNNPQLWNKYVDELQVLPPQKATDKLRHKAAFVVTIYTSDPAIKQLGNSGVKAISFPQLAWKYSEIFMPHGALELPHKIYEQADDVKKAMSLWADDISRREYLAQLKWRTYLERSLLPSHLPPEQIYFPDDIVSLSDNEVFVDCGAFDGDSVRSFLKRQGSSFNKVIAIEPDPTNFYRLNTYFSTLPETVRNKVRTINLAIGSSRRTVFFNATGTAGSAVGSGSSKVECATLDEILSDEAPTYIKMDIEGAELDALFGCYQLIKKNSAVLAICLYHKQEHLWQIPLFIQSVSSRYRLFLRRYSDECWEQVCYAVPFDRLIEKPIY